MLSFTRNCYLPLHSLPPLLKLTIDKFFASAVSLTIIATPSRALFTIRVRCCLQKLFTAYFPLGRLYAVIPEFARPKPRLTVGGTLITTNVSALWS